MWLMDLNVLRLLFIVKIEQRKRSKITPLSIRMLLSISIIYHNNSHRHNKAESIINIINYNFLSILRMKHFFLKGYDLEGLVLDDDNKSHQEIM